MRFAFLLLCDMHYQSPAVSILCKYYSGAQWTIAAPGILTALILLLLKDKP